MIIYSAYKWESIIPKKKNPKQTNKTKQNPNKQTNKQNKTLKTC